MGEYLVRCVSDGSVQPPYSLSCPHDNSLLRAEYKARQLRLLDLPGIWRFRGLASCERNHSRSGRQISDL